MEYYQGGRPLHLSGKRRRMILGEVGICLEIAAEREYMTIRSRAEVLNFKNCQRAGLEW